MDNQTTAQIPPAAQPQVSGDEKTLALFCHLSLFLGGILLPIIFWATNKDKSKFVTFHSLQSVWFHVAYILILVVIVMFSVFGGIALGALTGFSSSHMKTNSMSPFVVFMMIIMYGLIFIIFAAGVAYAIYMGIKAYHGEYKKYPIIGNIIYKKVYGSN